LTSVTVRTATQSVGSVPFSTLTFDEACSYLATPAQPGGAQAVRLANAWCVALAGTDDAYRSVLCGPGLNLPDGTPVSWVLRWRTRHQARRAEQVRGPSLFNAVLDADSSVTRHFFLGGTPDTLGRLLDAVGEQFPQAQVAGAVAPPFGPLTRQGLDEWADDIAVTGATIVWVGLGTPKQDFASVYLAERLGVHCVGVGAAFDFLAGTQAEAPRWIRRLALEWLFRLACEPRRLWRRYVFGNVRFLAAVVRDRPRAT
jgi:N-acetylglucosaminyldiphosphoundecaprenol N-acetyl-beta-D-mannosaminyltransferase